MTVIMLNPTTGPNAQETIDLVHEIQSSHIEGVKLHVTGTTAMNIDISEKLTVGIFFSLAMDYEVFLVSRMREE